MNNLFCFGLGYTAQFIAAKLHDWEITGTHRDKDIIYSSIQKLNDEALQKLLQADAVLVSIPPDENGDPVFHDYAEILRQSKNLKWLGVFSTTGVYGDAGGAWVDETTPVNPQNAREKNRVLAEQQWLSTNLPVHIFRLSGIYGPARSALDRAKQNAPIIEKSGHIFNRIHVADIAQAVVASIQHPTPHEIYNLSDDLPAGGDEVLRYAYELLGMSPPDVMLFEQAELSSVAKEFYAANKRVNAEKIKQHLEFDWLYPNYPLGLKSLL
jgi:hypothetical protein